jgi:ribokinase
MRTAVVGHVEWTQFVRVERVPSPGAIVEPTDAFEVPAGGGSVASVQLARLAGSGGDCTFYTALGDDDLAPLVIDGLRSLGVRVEAVLRPGERTRRAFVFLDDAGERTITTIGKRHHPVRTDPLPWDELSEVGAVYFVAGDPDALRAARAARGLVATARVMPLLSEAGVQLDAVVGSGSDAAERYRPLDPTPRFVVVTDGARGGSWTGAEGRTGKWSAVPLPGEPADAYGCGDSFAAGLTFALGSGDPIDDALSLAARCGATCMTGRGPYGRQLTAAEL